MRLQKNKMLSMGKKIVLLLFIVPFLAFSESEFIQESIESDTSTENMEHYIYVNDSIQYNKSSAYVKQRKFKDDLK